MPAMPADAAELVVPEVDLAGEEPVLPPPKKKKKVAAGMAAEEPEAALQELVGEDLASDDEPLEVPGFIADAPRTNIRSHESLRVLVPGRGGYPGIGLQKLRKLNAFRAYYTASIAEEYRPFTEKKYCQKTFERSWQTDRAAKSALQAVVDWLWHKHMLLAGKGKPKRIGQLIDEEAWREALEEAADPDE